MNSSHNTIRLAATAAPPPNPASTKAGSNNHVILFIRWSPLLRTPRILDRTRADEPPRGLSPPARSRYTMTLHNDPSLPSACSVRFFDIADSAARMSCRREEVPASIPSRWPSDAAAPRSAVGLPESDFTRTGQPMTRETYRFSCSCQRAWMISLSALRAPTPTRGPSRKRLPAGPEAGQSVSRRSAPFGLLARELPPDVEGIPPAWTVDVPGARG